MSGKRTTEREKCFFLRDPDKQKAKNFQLHDIMLQANKASKNERTQTAENREKWKFLLFLKLFHL